VILLALPERRTAERVVAAALSPPVLTLPGALRRNLTWDQGKKLAAHERQGNLELVATRRQPLPLPGDGLNHGGVGELYRLHC